MPDQRHESHHKICNLRYGTHGYGMSACKIQGVHLLKLKVSSMPIHVTSMETLICAITIYSFSSIVYFFFPFCLLHL